METDIKKYKVDIYFSSFCSYEIFAANEEEAIIIARQKNVKKEEVILNLERWEEADTIHNLSDEKREV